MSENQPLEINSVPLGFTVDPSANKLAESHSPEPWNYMEADNSITSGTKTVAIPTSSRWVSLEARKANAKRIVLCVNFSAGLTTEAIELMVKSGFPTLSHICSDNQALRKERDELRRQLEQAKNLLTEALFFVDDIGTGNSIPPLANEIKQFLK